LLSAVLIDLAEQDLNDLSSVAYKYLESIPRPMATNQFCLNVISFCRETWFKPKPRRGDQKIARDERSEPLEENGRKRALKGRQKIIAE
jgi:hypothetical protein